MCDGVDRGVNVRQGWSMLLLSLAYTRKVELNVTRARMSANTRWHLARPTSQDELETRDGRSENLRWMQPGGGIKVRNADRGHGQGPITVDGRHLNDAENLLEILPYT